MPLNDLAERSSRPTADGRRAVNTISRAGEPAGVVARLNHDDEEERHEGCSLYDDIRCRDARTTLGVLLEPAELLVSSGHPQRHQQIAARVVRSETEHAFWIIMAPRLIATVVF